MNLFISYRRDDSQGHAGRLYDSLTGYAMLFMDVDNIEAGDRFPTVIEENLNNSDALLCVIGPRWSTVQDEVGRRRIDLPGDFVRMEIATALERAVPVIPVLVWGAPMPSPAALPDDLRPLADLQASTLTHQQWHADIERLKRAIKKEVLRSRGRGQSQLGKNQAPLTGREILVRWLNQDRAPYLMGRNRGLTGAPLRSDIDTGAWKIRRYEVTYEKIEPPPTNWLRISDFVEQVAPTAVLDPGELKIADALMTGQEIVDRVKSGDSPPSLMARKGGVAGQAMNRDIAESSWKDQRYQVSYSRVAQLPRNWFAVSDFLTRLEETNRA